MVCGAINTTFEDRSITTKDLNPSGGTGDNNEVTQNPNTRSRVGSLANPHATSKAKFRNVELEVRKGALTGRTCRSRMH